MITSQGERDREREGWQKRGGRRSQDEREKEGGRMAANVLKEIAGMSFLGWNESNEFGQTRGKQISVTPLCTGLMQAVAGRKGEPRERRGGGVEWV